jgi:hypothetical protein
MFEQCVLYTGDATLSHGQQSRDDVRGLLLHECSSGHANPRLQLHVSLFAALVLCITLQCGFAFACGARGHLVDTFRAHHDEEFARRT